jgi:sodium/hydrogen antiporter
MLDTSPYQRQRLSLGNRGAMEHSLNVSALAVVSACVVIWGLVSARLERLDVSAPIAFVVLGLIVTHGPLTLIHLQLHSSTIRALVEVTLALVLFVDASRVHVRALLSDISIPVRLLGIGLPLTIGAGAAVAAGLFGWAGIWVAALLGAIVAPTDAALGAAIMSDERVPASVRRSLNVESGLNDGVATPFVNLFLAGALSAEALGGSGVGAAALDLLGGAALGAAIGLVGGLLLRVSRRTGWGGVSFRSLAVLALALFAYATALVVGINGFVAAFVAGMAFGSAAPRDAELVSFAEESGTLLSLIVWFMFGAVMLVPGLRVANWRDLVFALVALTIVRMGPVALALVGSGLKRSTVAFIGWFGPRGLASVVFGLIATDALAPTESRLVLGAVSVTVALSVLAHGVSAAPLVRRYAASMAKLHPSRPELVPTSSLPTRTLRGRRLAGSGGEGR